MKRYYFIIIVITLALWLTLTLNCKKEEEKTVLSAKTKLPEENAGLTNVLVNVDTLRLIYKSGATKPKFNSSDIVIGQIGEGYLKKVVSTTTRGDTLILLTEQASLTDAIKKCDVETTFSLTPSSKKMGSIRTDTSFIGKDGKYYRMTLQSEGVLVQPSPEGMEFEIRLPNVRIEIRDDENNLTAYISCDTVVIRKGIDFDFAIKIESFEIKEFRAIASSSDGLDFKAVRLGLERSIFNKEIQQKLTTVPLGTIIVMAGPVPIVFVFEFGVYAGLGVDLTLNLSCEILNNVSLSSTNSVGARYENGSWEPVLEKTLDGNANFSFGPSASLTAELHSFLKGSLDSKVYGIAGPCLYLKPYQYNEVTFPPFDYDLGIGLGAGLGFKVEIFSWLLAEFNWTFADYRTSLIHSTTPTNNPPNTPSTPSGPSSGQVGISYDFTTSTTDPDGDDISYQFNWGGGIEDTSNWSEFVQSGIPKTLSKSWSSANTYSVKARAKDTAGGISGWSGGHQITVTGIGYPNRVIDTVLVGDFPLVAVAIPNGNYVYVTNGWDDNVSVINVSNNTVVDTIRVGDTPEGITVLPNGDYIYVANANSDNVSVIRTSDNAVIDTIPVGNCPMDIIALANGYYVYTANRDDDNVSVIRTADNTVVDTIAVRDEPIGITATPDGNYVYVVNRGSDSVSVIRTSNNTVIATIPVGSEPHDVDVLPNGNYIYVANAGSDNISVIQTSNNSVIDSISVGDHPEGIAVLPNGNYIYVSNGLSDNVSVIQTSNNSVIDTISVGDGPEGLAVLPNGNCVYVANNFSDDVSVIGYERWIFRTINYDLKNTDRVGGRK